MTQKGPDKGKLNTTLGWPEPAAPVAQVELYFKSEADIEHVNDPLRLDLSAAALVGQTLFVACDETATVESLTTDDWQVFRGHETHHLGDYFKLPDGPHDEMDIEGLTADDGFLWIVGSHSLTRDDPEPGDNSSEEALEELTDIDRDSNRFFLGRVPLVAHLEKQGCFGLGAKGVESKGANGSKGDLTDSVDETLRTAACVKMNAKGNALTEALDDDPHLGAFLSIPSKENGFDIEGIAVSGNRVALGLRGPVLRGWACILELHLDLHKPHRLKPKKIGPDGERYLKHFVDLDGLGIRDLKLDDRDLLILAGPTMDLDGPAALYRWPDWLDGYRPAVLHPAKTDRLLDLPFGKGTEHPEAIVRWPEADTHRFLLLNDSPGNHRLSDEANAIKADLFDLP
ncbi:MAG: DUF3616 domain-containing protein [Geminicoccaceae bacterium]